MNPKVKAAFEKHIKASPYLGFHALVFGVRADGLYLSARRRIAYEMFAAGYEARSVERAEAPAMAHNNPYYWIVEESLGDGTIAARSFFESYLECVREIGGCAAGDYRVALVRSRPYASPVYAYIAEDGTLPAMFTDDQGCRAAAVPSTFLVEVLKAAIKSGGL